MNWHPRQSDCPKAAWAMVLAWLMLATSCLAQEPAAAKPSRPSAKSSTEQVLPGEVLPKVYVLKDKDGNLQAMPGISFEEFMETWKAKNQLGQAHSHPAYSIGKLSLSGTASRGRAELSAEFDITLLDSGWVGVPLRLSDTVMREPLFEGPGDHVLRFDPQRDGYVVWVRSEPATAHRVKLKLLSTVGQVGAESHLRLNLARAAESRLQLDVPLEHALAKVSEGATLDSIKPLEGGRSRLNLVGLGGELDLAWHASEAQLAALPTVLEATGSVFVRINGRSINSEAKLVVRSLGGQFDRFQVRLPPGMQLVGNPPPGMSLTRVEGAAAKDLLYEVKLDKKGVGPLEVSLHAERNLGSPPPGTQAAEEPIELGGFEVVGAVRQSGTVAVKVEGNWQVVWGDSNQVTQIDDLTAIARRDDLTAAFEYSAQPYSLPARIMPQRTRVRAEGEYVLQVGSEEVQLGAKLKYTIRGAKVRSLDVELPGWEIDAVGPSSLVNVDAVPTQNDPLSIPLLQAASGELELSIEAHQKLPPDSELVTFELPRPRAETVAPANVAVVPADNIELTFDAARSVALAPQTVPAGVKLPQRLQDPLFFRTDAQAARFAGTAKLHEQSITASMNTQVDLEDSTAQVDSRIAYRIAYEAADHLTLNVPRGVRPERLTLTLDGQRLSAAPARERNGEAAETVPLRVTLPGPRIGRCELQVHYTARHDRAPAAAAAQVSIPLVVPGDAQVTINELLVVPRAGISVSYPQGPWNEVATDLPAEKPGALALSARRALTDVSLAIHFTQLGGGATTIERAWIQSLLTDSQRRDRAVFRLTTSQPRLQLTMPSGADLATLSAEIDGRRVGPESIRQRDVTFAMPPGSSSEHTLDVRYHFTERPASGSLSLAPVRVKTAEWVEQLYWQLVLPAREHVLFVPEHFTREYRWTWSNLFWQREPTWEQKELETWIGMPASPSARLPDETQEQYAIRQETATASSNRYLFSTVGTIEPLEVYTLSRARLMLWASLPLLLGGLLLIYWPAARHPAVLFAMAVLVAAGGLIDPESALLFAQASSLGLVLAAAAALLARMSARPAPPNVPAAHGSSRAVLERGMTEVYHRAATHGSPPSTATEPVVSTSSPEGEPS